MVEAAGGLVVDDEGRVLVVHRPRYDDWSLPKGKTDPGERLEECALREVEEETGYRCRLGDPISTISYVDNKGRDKNVHYWRMTVIDGGFAANAEVDEIRWVSPPEAARLLSYAGDRDVLRSAVS